MMTNNRLTVECHRLIAIEISSLDQQARKLEQLWGIGRLELLAPTDFRLRFEQQRDLLNKVLESDDASREEILQQIGGMKRAWLALETTVANAGHRPTPATVWEAPNPDGGVFLIVRDDADASQAAIQAKERNCQLYTLAEIGRLLSRYPEIAKIKDAFPGAMVTSVQSKMPTAQFLNDEIPFN